MAKKKSTQRKTTSESNPVAASNSGGAKKKTRKQQLQESEQRFRTIFEQAAVGVALIETSTGRFVRINKRYCDLVGYMECDMLTKTYQDITHPEDLEEDLENMRRLVAGEIREFTMEKRHLRQDGSAVWVNLKVSPTWQAGEEPRNHIAIVEDITERKRTEVELRRSSKVFTDSADSIFIKDLTGRIVDMNRAAERQYGWSRDELIGKSIKMLAPPEEHEQREELMARCLRGEEVRSVEASRVTKSGKALPMLLTLSLLTDESGQPVGIATIAEDISERKQAERAWRESEAQTRAILASLSAHIAVVDRTGTIVAVNPAWEEFARENEGIALRCNVGANYLEVCRTATGDYRDEAPKVAAGLQAILDGTANEFSLEYPCHSDTQERWFILQATALHHEEVGAVVSHTNITERVNAEQLLRASEQRMRAILNTATDTIITIDQRGIINSVNPATAQMFGYSEEELVGQNVKMLMPPPYCDEHDGYIARYLKTAEARIIGIGRELVGKRKDGSTFPVDLAVNAVDHVGPFTGVIRDISERKKLQRDVLSIAEDEQRRIGQDLHDSAQQELAGLGMLAQTLLDNLSKQPTDLPKAGTPDSSQIARKIVDGIARTLQEVQSISRGLVPIRLDVQGLMDALRELASRTDELEGVACAFKCEQAVELADSLTATHFYRIAQEAVANALKHGRPEHILIALETDNGRPLLQVADDGTGFDSTEENEGTGLKTMQYRASLIGASLTVGPVETGGTLVTCKVVGGENLR